MECRAYGICLDSQSRGYLGKDRKVSSAAGGNLSRMHKTQETAKESRLNFMYRHLRNRTLEGSANAYRMCCGSSDAGPKSPLRTHRPECKLGRRLWRTAASVVTVPLRISKAARLYTSSRACVLRRPTPLKRTDTTAQ